MTEKRYMSNHIVGVTSPFIVDNYSAKEHNKFVSYKTYETTTMEKCDELTDLLNNYEDEIKHLKKDDLIFFQNVFHILLKYQDLFNREMADEVLDVLGIELTRWFE